MRGSGNTGFHRPDLGENVGTPMTHHLPGHLQYRKKIRFISNVALLLIIRRKFGFG